MWPTEQAMQNIGLKQIGKLLPMENGFRIGDDFFIVPFRYNDNLHFLKYPCRSDAYIAVFCKSGEFSVEVNLRTYHVGKHGVFISTPGNIVRVSEEPGNPEGMEFIAMAISKEYLSSISFDVKKIFDDRLTLLADPCVMLDEKELEFCDKYIDLLGVVMETDVPNKKEAVGSLIASFFYFIAGLFENNFAKMPETDIPHSSATRVKLVFEHFMSLVTEYHSTERNMSFYAGRLGLTPKYLSKLIKQVSGRSGPAWIDSFVILEAKNMLKYTDAPIKEIVYKLNFPNPSVFYKFFKAHTGMTPSEYRNG